MTPSVTYAWPLSTMQQNTQLCVTATNYIRVSAINWLINWRSLSWAISLHSRVILHEWLAFYSASFFSFSFFFISTWVPLETAAVSAQVLCTPYNHAPCHFMQSHMRKVYACLAVTCHLHFWQNDQDLCRATVVRLGWNRYQNKSQRRKLTQEKNIFLPGLEPVTFWSWVQCSNHWPVPTPLCWHTLTWLKFATVPTLKQCWIYIWTYSAHL